MSDPNSQPWFHGRISRKEAEEKLKSTKQADGTYLLRESTTAGGSYVLSVCVEGKVVHYQIQRKRDGTVGIEDGPQFPGPVELVHHHEVNLDGLLTRLTIGCKRPRGVKAKAYQNISHDDLEEATRHALAEEGIQSEEAVIKFKGDVEDVLGTILHKKQSWFHGIIPREEADRRLENSGCEDGRFLIRERGNPRRSYVLGVCFQGKVYHYLFDPNDKGQLSIKQGRLFDNLMHVVDHYREKSDGLLCKLGEPVDVNMFQVRPRSTSEQRNILLDPDIQTEVRRRLSTYGEEFNRYKKPKSSAPRVNIPPGGRGPAPAPPISPSGRHPVPPPVPASSKRPPLPGMHGADLLNAWKYEDIYDSAKVRGTEGFHSPFSEFAEPRNFYVDSRKLSLEEELGHGNFGSVMKGLYTLRPGKNIAVAVKTLKEEDIPSQKSEIINEAEIMANLDHPNIVRMIGIAQGPPMMLVMELAPQGPLHKYLKKHRNMTILSILILLLQVDEGMQYLESQHFVHRDLAARNVLVVSENFVKISDFGMSRAMGAGNEYYRAERAGKWPLKWYAPECIFYFKFTSKSDVWSYGITMWESLSYGAKPYGGKKGQQIIEDLERGYRLEKPDGCSKEVHDIMKKCWEFSPERRPTFQEIGQMLSDFIEKERRKRLR